MGDTGSHDATKTGGAAGVTTHFAPAERRSGEELAADVRQAVDNEFITGLMSMANGLFAVLNEARQVVALNDAFLRLLGVEDAGTLLGLRPGEVVHCVHADDMPGGCGTSEFCITCGAVVAIVSALETRQPQERTCALTVQRGRKTAELFLSVRSCPVTLGDSRYVLLFLQDISVQQQRACLDRSFFHDINNILCALVGKSELISNHADPSVDKLKELHGIVLRIAQEVSIQNTLQRSLDAAYKPLYADTSVNAILDDLRQMFDDHPLTTQRSLRVEAASSDRTFTTDFHLVSRILINMVTNALEATGEWGTVTLIAQPQPDGVCFRVWNAGEIPEPSALRVFQRNFSTKDQWGRGLGTYSMKLFGEQVLGGQVDFTTSASEGTTFRFLLPMR